MGPTDGATGTALVDWGLYVAAAMAGRDSVASLSDGDLKKLIMDRAADLAGVHQRLDAFIPIFGSNTPLHNPKKKGQKPGEAHQEKYATLLKGLASAVGNEQGREPCEACGRTRSLPPGQMGQAVFGRDWFPLAGAQTEANLLPAASRGPQLCARCLIAVRLLPSAPFLIDGRMTVLQSMPPRFAELFARDLYEHVRDREQAGDTSTVGKKEGVRALMRRLLSVLDRLHEQQHLDIVDVETRLFSWQFSNSGKAGKQADVVLEEIPNGALAFLRDATRAGLRPEIDRLLQREPTKDSERTPSLMRCLMRGADYEPLYPSGPHSGASVPLFTLYQREVLGRSSRTLAWASWMGAGLRRRVGAGKREVAVLRKPEAFYASDLRTQFRASLVDQALTGQIGLPQYLSVFPKRGGSPVLVDASGWKLLRFYGNQSVSHVDAAPAAESLFEDDPVQFRADRMLARILAERGHQFARNHTLRRLGSEGARWLSEQFCLCASAEGGFTSGAWLSLAQDPGGDGSILEWAFQTRLALAARLADNAHLSGLSHEVVEEPCSLLDGSLLPDHAAGWIKRRLLAFRRVRGQKRLEADIARPATRGRIEVALRTLAALDRDDQADRIEWDAWLEGRDRHEGRHRLCLAIANAVRRLGSGAATDAKEDTDA
jgi:hypothetical protein